MAEDLGAVLRREADRHVPDGDAMFDRINRRRFAPEPVRASRPFLSSWGLRPVAAAASVVAVLVAGFTGIRLLTSDEPKKVSAATTSTTSVAPTPTTSAPLPARTSAKPKHTGGGGATTSTPRSNPSSMPPSFRPVSGFVSTSGTVDAHSTETWGQSDVTLTTTQAITALDLAISVARTAGLKSTGNWSTIPAERVTITLTEQPDALVYRFTLKPGGELAAGKYVFAGQYEHAAGKRDLSADVYGAICSAGDRKAEVTGAFTVG